MIRGSATLWKVVSFVLLLVVLVEAGLLVESGYLSRKTRVSSTATKDDGFEAFEGIAFAREFSERFQTFDSRNFKATQTATAFLFDDKDRADRLVEIERLQEKLERRDVVQKARLLTLMRLPNGGDRFRADLQVELNEGAGVAPIRSQFVTRLEFNLIRSERTPQNMWGFRVAHLTQQVLPSASATIDTANEFSLRPGVAALVRFPCSIENVELPKATSVRVKLTTLDISELQMKTDTALPLEQTIRAVCRDRAFTMKVRAETAEASKAEPLVVLKSLSMENSVPLVKASTSVRPLKAKHPKGSVEKSIEEQLGFVVEEE